MCPRFIISCGVKGFAWLATSMTDPMPKNCPLDRSRNRASSSAFRELTEQLAWPQHEFTKPLRSLASRYDESRLSKSRRLDPPFDDNIRFVARPFGTSYDTDDYREIPIRTSTFLAPGTPFNIYGGLKINSMEGTMLKTAQISFSSFQAPVLRNRWQNICRPVSARRQAPTAEMRLFLRASRLPLFRA